MLRTVVIPLRFAARSRSRAPGYSLPTLSCRPFIGGIDYFHTASSRPPATLGRPHSTAAAAVKTGELEPEHWEDSASLLASPHNIPLDSPNPTLTPLSVVEIATQLRDKYGLPSILRPYQLDVIDACMTAIKEKGLRRLGVSSPTGSGKTVMFTYLIPLLRALRANTSPADPKSPPRNQILILVGNIELAHQAYKTILKLLNGPVAPADAEEGFVGGMGLGLSVELEQGKNKASGFADVTIATYHSLRPDRLMERYDPRRFCAVIVDEAHHAAAKSYRTLLSAFNEDVLPPKDERERDDVLGVRLEGEERDTIVIRKPRPGGKAKSRTASENVDLALPGARDDVETCRGDQDRAMQGNGATDDKAIIIGFTATFSRHDQLALSAVFEEIVYHQDVWDMLQAGWLAPARFTTVKVDWGLEQVAVSRTTGDFVSNSLVQVINTQQNNEMIVGTWLQRAPERKSTLVFCVDIAHVHAMVDMFRKAGLDARPISGRTPDAERKALIEGFKRKEFPILVNCQILTEGTDIPNVDCILIARPTKSRNLFSQMIGRGLRHAEGKTDVRIIDFLDNKTSVNGLVSPPTLFGLDPDDKDLDDNDFMSLRERGEAAEATRAEHARQEAQRNAERRIKSLDYEDDDDPFQLDNPESKAAGRWNSKYAWVACGDGKYVLEAFGGGGYFSIVPQDNLFALRHAIHLPAELRRPGRGEYGQIQAKGISDDLGRIFQMGDRLIERMVPRAVVPALTRFASWRNRPASDAQKTHIAKIVSRRPQCRGLDDSAREAEIERKYGDMTSGKAAAVLTALKHGAAGRADRRQRQSRNQQLKNDKAEVGRAHAFDSIQVGPL